MTERSYYQFLHKKYRSLIEYSGKCNRCGIELENPDLSNNSGNYLDDINDWEYLCRKCHRVKDLKLNGTFIGDKVPVQFSLKPLLHKELKLIAIEKDTTISEIVRKLVEGYLATERKL